MDTKQVSKKLDELQFAISNNTNAVFRLEKYFLNNKKIFTVDELSEYTGFSKSYIYKLVARNELPFSKPLGKILFFEKLKIDEWILQKSNKSSIDIQNQAESYVFSKK